MAQRIGEVHRSAVGAPAEAVRNADAALHRRQRTLAVEPVQRPFRRARLVVHRAGPEAALAVDAAVVEAMAGDRRRRRIVLQRTGLAIEQRDPVRQRDEEPVVAFDERDRPDEIRHVPGLDAAAREIEAANRRPADVDPKQRLLALVPERALAEDVGLFADATHCVGCFRHGEAELSASTPGLVWGFHQLRLRRQRRLESKRRGPSLHAKAPLPKF